MDPLLDEQNLLDALSQLHEATQEHLKKLRSSPVNKEWNPEIYRIYGDYLPNAGMGVLPVVENLINTSFDAATLSSGSRFFNFIVGGATPAALVADWLVSVLDQNVAGRISSNYGTLVEETSIRWLVELFGLPETWGGALVASATFANFTGLACARQWWGEQLGFNVAQDGITDRPKMHIFSGGYVHPSVRKALQILGHGQQGIEVFSEGQIGSLNLKGMRRRLQELDGLPSVVVASAGEVNTGDFDPIRDVASLAKEFNAWFHIDAAFGIFARLSPKTAQFVDGIELADSIAADAHKWLNVPYESGFCLLQDPSWLPQSFDMPTASYIADLEKIDGGFAKLGPEASRRARAIPIWATLSAYGREGYQQMVERHIELAHRLANHLNNNPDFETLSEVKLPIVCFRYSKVGNNTRSLSESNSMLVQMINQDGRFSVGRTKYEGHTALRVAIFNWRITAEEIDELFELLCYFANKLDE
jgi:glutamate/tyrosine decarboxylase-like PLP-dependent enzyme